MFPIMTEEQIKAADEEVLRQRVRELSSASAVLREIRDLLQTHKNILTNTHGVLVKCHGILATLLMIATDTPKFDKIDRRPRKRKTRKTAKRRRK